jgi:CHRD domain
MREKFLVGTVVALALGVAGCGGGSGSSSSVASSKTAAKAGPIVIYRTALSGTTGTPTGAPGGAGNAIVALHGRTVLCWRFAHLHGFVHATAAHIQLGSKASAHVIASLSTGSRLRHKGCLTVSPATAKAIQKRPSAYYLAIDSTSFPAGAVRGRL